MQDMKTSAFYRIAAILLLLFDIGHTLGFRQSDPKWGDVGLRGSMRSIHLRDIYLTPPGPRCSVFRHERGLSADLAGTGTTLQQGGGLRGVPGLSALAPGMGMSAMRRTGGVVGCDVPAGAVASADTRCRSPRARSFRTVICR